MFWGETLGLSRPPQNISADYRPFPAKKPQLTFQKEPVFRSFRLIWWTFFSKNSILVQKYPKMTKNDFSELLWALKVTFIHF